MKSPLNEISKPKETEKMAVSGCTKFLIAITIIFLVIAIGCLFGGYLPGKLFNARVEQRICHIYYNVRSRYCRSGTTTSKCFDVVMNVRPNGTNCWQAPAIATFHNEKDAYEYAASQREGYRDCLWDPNNRCTYYYSYVDVDTLFAAGTSFAILFGVSLLLSFISGFRHRFGCCGIKTISYDDSISSAKEDAKESGYQV